jgi:hypothetical protein
MKDGTRSKLQVRLAATGAWVQAALLLEMLFTVLLLLPGETGITPDTLEGVYSDPALFLTFVREHGVLRWMLDPDLPFAICLFVTVWGVGAHLGEESPELSRLATAVGVVSSAFFLLVGMVELVSVPELSRLYAADPSAAVAGYRGVSVLWNGFAAGALVVNGVWILLVGVGGLRGRSLPRSLCYFGAVPAIGAFFYFLFPPLQLLAGLGYLVWLTWLGMVLWRPRSQVGT